MEINDRVRVKSNYGTACDGMTGIILSIQNGDATVLFSGDGKVDLPLGSLIKID